MCKSFGLETTAKLKKDAVPTSFKRKVTEALEPAAKKPAYEKRERLRVLKATRHLHRSIPPSDPALILTDNYNDTTPEPQPEHLSQSVGTQIERIVTRSVKVQTVCIKAPRKRSASTQTISFPTRSMCDIGVQCDLSGEEPIHVSNESEDVFDDDEEFLISDASSTTSDGSYCNEEMTECVLKDNLNCNFERKYIVCEGALLSLFSSCNHCGSFGVSVTKLVKGTFLRVKKKCNNCKTLATWDSQPLVNEIPECNLLLTAAILFNGCLPEKTLRIFHTIGCATISRSTFFHHQRHFLYQAIFYVWDMKQQAFFVQLADEGTALVLGGDGRADSPGHSAKYGTYSLVELNHNIILDIQLVQSNEVKNSNNMELEGLKRAMTKVNEHGMEISTLITDCHQQISKWLRETHPNIRHHFDVWHLAKGIKKKVNTLAKQQDCEMIREWSKSIINHLYWCAVSTPDGNQDMIHDKWLSLINHIHNKHHHSGLFKKCLHGRICNRAKKKWFKPQSKPSIKIIDLLSKNRLCNQIKKLSPLHQTSGIEAFHSVVIQFAPKLQAFSYKGMLARQKLAALHYNENGNKKQSFTKEGKGQYSISFPKYKQGGHIVRQLKTKSTYSYVKELMDTVLELAKGNKSFVSFFDDNNHQIESPQPLCQVIGVREYMSIMFSRDLF
ncbi:PREDICTED: uncharacterized protein LOC109587862 [Amphimedon queenslandica]|nr:PREDICTED: uncharacterized protein LOC109587862 [Amphimedon queenslandica]|eukprot:XP_019859639.1 PREDICTED: uncharacterized protein LOC109587862 [Amphimedon queenslandica]